MRRSWHTVPAAITALPPDGNRTATEPLPAIGKVRAHPADLGIVAAPAAPPDRRGRAPEMARVLLVEDNDDIHDPTALRLELNGHDVVAVADAGEARVVGSEQAFDVAVLDIELPDTDGIALLRQLRSAPPTAHLPVVFYTAHSSAEVAARAATLAQAYLTKEQSLNRLLDTIAAVLR
jgi:CheY-like chemotaxis protein